MVKTLECDVCKNEVDAHTIEVVTISASPYESTPTQETRKDVCPSCMNEVYAALKISEEERLQIF